MQAFCAVGFCALFHIYGSIIRFVFLFIVFEWRSKSLEAQEKAMPIEGSKGRVSLEHSARRRISPLFIALSNPCRFLSNSCIFIFVFNSNYVLLFFRPISMSVRAGPTVRETLSTVSKACGIKTRKREDSEYEKHSIEADGAQWNVHDFVPAWMLLRFLRTHGMGPG